MHKIERHILNIHPVNYVVNKSKRLILPGFEGVPLYDVIGFFRRQLRVHGLTERASAIAFNFVMSIPPTCLFLFTLIPNLPFVSKKGIKIQLNNFITDIIPAKNYNEGIIKFVNSFFGDARIGIISFGLLLSLFFASNGLMGIMRSFDRDYIGFEKRTGLRKRWMAIKLTCLLFALFLACILLMLSQSNVLTWLGVKNFTIKQIIVYGRWVPIIGLLFYSFAFIFKYAPATQKRWHLNSPGAILATFFSILFYLGFSSFVNNFGTYNILYGSVGTIIVIMIIVFLNSMAILIGFELNVSIKSLKVMSEERKKEEAALVK